MRFVLQYIAAMWADWVSRMSGLASLVFTVVALIFNLKDLGQARYWIAAAMISYVIASFWVWYKHRPDLTIEGKGIWLDAGVTVEELERISSYVTIRLCMVNTRSATNAIKSYSLTVEIDGKPREAVPVPCDRLMLNSIRDGFMDLNAHKYSVMQQGWPTEGWVRLLVAGLTLDEALDKTFALVVTDVYNVTYKIKGRTPAERRNEIAIDPRFL